MTSQAFRKSTVCGGADTVVCGSLAKKVKVIVVSIFPAEGNGPIGMLKMKMELLATLSGANCAD